MTPPKDHPLRHTLANELHARPFPSLNAPCLTAYLAIKQPSNAAARNREKDREHLLDLLDRYGAPHPPPGATHYSGKLGQFTLKWEQHTEFVTYTAFDGTGNCKTFDPACFNFFPEDWLESAPGVRLTSAIICVNERPDDENISENLKDLYIAESLAVSWVLDDMAIIAGDFRIDASGHMRFSVFVNKNIGARRIGRIVQQLCEIETYKSMSMLGLARVRAISEKIGEIETKLATLMEDMSGDTVSPDKTLKSLLYISADLEALIAQTSFRLGATAAYEAIVNQRIEVLRENRFGGRQTFSEFMTRRFDPAMRTVKSSEKRLLDMAKRAMRAGNLLRTRVDVERSAQNQTLLESMDKRAALQLRLQKTVEGLSVVAISYYAVNLVIYMAGPAGKTFGLSKLTLTAVATPIVIAVVWFIIRRVRNSME